MDGINTNLLNAMPRCSSLPSLTFLTPELRRLFLAVCLNPDDTESKFTTRNLIVSFAEEKDGGPDMKSQFGYFYFFFFRCLRNTMSTKEKAGVLLHFEPDT